MNLEKSLEGLVCRESERDNPSAFFPKAVKRREAASLSTIQVRTREEEFAENATVWFLPIMQPRVTEDVLSQYQLGVPVEMLKTPQLGTNH
jgi:hypothetical protein